MNNAHTYLIQKIAQAIPMEILQLAFEYTNTPPYMVNQDTLYTKIDYNVIIGILLRDCDLINGEEVVINIDGCSYTYNNNYTVVRIPFERTRNREIIVALSLAVGYPSQTVGPNVTDSYDPVEGGQFYSRVYIDGPNTISVEGQFYPTLNTQLRCVLGNREDLGNINPRALPILGDLAILACKSYIYNHLIVKLRNGVVVTGMDLGAISEIVNGYEGALEEYNQLLRTKWKKITYMNDPYYNQRYISMIVPK